MVTVQPASFSLQYFWLSRYFSLGGSAKSGVLGVKAVDEERYGKRVILGTLLFWAV